METDITCIYATARPGEGSIVGRPIDHIELFLDSLTLGEFKDFEVIIADCYYSRQKYHVEDNTYKGVKYPFNIIHFQVKSPWLNRGCWTGQAPWNQAALLARGELLCLFGDCCEPPQDYLKRIWDWYIKGYWCMGLVIYKKNGDIHYVKKEDLVEPIPDADTRVWDQGITKNVKELVRRGFIKDIVRDSRWPFVEHVPFGATKLRGRAGSEQFHGYSCVPLKAFMKINGFDENFDGDKALGDCDFGLRLLPAGYDNVLALDKNVWIFENAHFGVPKELLHYEGPTVKSNYSLMLLNEQKKRWKANSYKLTEAEVNHICHHAKDWGFKDIDMKANPLFRWWIEYPPIFDLEELRWDVQNDLDDGIINIPDYYVDNYEE